ncbi:hypothetical protein Raf01_51500 [Rugosimonospora africana]|uniref:S-adenosyl methyltransferase n=1 Tax=Rugosimonospora africana TaxID=556532 RepID=A0A8J3VSZ1_9ACTN|nr:hypothetical protein Raf01_51500 [Rugosimonospora africana]
MVVADQPDWVPEGLDVTVPNAARVYDCALGGYHNFGVDREFKDLAEKAWPGISQLAYANRAFLGRVVQWLVESGIRQFLDIGSGIPTLGNVHEVAQEIAPESRVVYVDIDPVAVSHSRAILTGNPYADAIQGDLRRPEEILYHPQVLELLDFSQPVAVLMIAVLHFISDDADPPGIVTKIAEPLVSGSYLALSHGTQAGRMSGEQEEVRQLYNRTPTPFFVRSPEQLADALAGLDIVEPGIVAITDWHPDPEEAGEPRQPAALGVVARKP